MVRCDLWPTIPRHRQRNRDPWPIVNGTKHHFPPLTPCRADCYSRIVNRKLLVRLLLIALSFASVAAGLSSVPDAALGLWYLFYSPVLISALSFGMRGAISGSAIALFCLLAILTRIDVSLYQTATQVGQTITNPQVSVTDVETIIREASRVPAGSAVPVISAADLERMLTDVRNGAVGLGQTSLQLLAATKSLGMQLVSVALGVGLISISSLVIGWQIDEGRRREVRSYEEARTDAMTGLPNYRRLRERLEMMLTHSAANAGQFTIIVVDIDRFKAINDTFGHLIGDGAIRYTADLLRENIRPSDLVARYGGDEFAILLEGVGPRDAERIGERILANAQSEPFLPGAGALAQIHLSIGVAIFPIDGNRAETLISAADDAMYRSKQAGGDQVVLAATSAAVQSAAPVVDQLRNTAPETSPA